VRSLIVTVALFATCGVRAADVLLIDNLGKVVAVPSNQVPAALQPAGGLDRQIPNPTKGTPVSPAVQQRVREQNESATGPRVFPAVQPVLMPYLASNDEFGNTDIKPGALISSTPFDEIPQDVKYQLSDVGLRYSLRQTATFVSLSDAMSGSDELGFYTLDLAGKWTVFDSGKTAGAVTFQVEEQSGLGGAGAHQNAGSNVGTTANPTGIYSSHNGWRVPELGWQQSLADGTVVLVAGMISQGNYFDSNSYAGNGRAGQFLNKALIDTMVVPLPNYNFGGNIEWQPSKTWYAMAGAEAGNANAGTLPWKAAEINPWTAQAEFGFTPADVAGLGRGVYRLQPFIAESGGWTQGGLGFNFQQKLGKQSPFGWFGRYGFAGSHVAAGAKEQIGTGFVCRGPFEHLLFERTSNDYLGIGFVWSQPAAISKTVFHENEYVLETTYAMQLTPTTKLQPDLQVVWNPTFNPDGSAVVFQMQLDLAW